MFFELPVPRPPRPDDWMGHHCLTSRGRGERRYVPRGRITDLKRIARTVQVGWL